MTTIEQVVDPLLRSVLGHDAEGRWLHRETGKPQRGRPCNDMITAYARARQAMLDFVRAIVAEVKAPQPPAAKPITGCNVTCTDADLARAVEVAVRLASADATGERTLLARALLRLHKDRDAYRAHFAADHALRRALSPGPIGYGNGLNPTIEAADDARQAALDEVLRVDAGFAREAMREPERDDALTAKPAGGKRVDEDIERIREQRRALPAFFEANPDYAGCRCHADRDGDCTWERCPQNRDGEPHKTGRCCPLDLATQDDDR